MPLLSRGGMHAPEEVSRPERLVTGPFLALGSSRSPLARALEATHEAWEPLGAQETALVVAARHRDTAEGLRSEN